MSDYGILSDQSIQNAVQDGSIEIDPFRPEQLNPASYDLRLGKEVRVYRDWVGLAYVHADRDGSELYAFNRVAVHDVRKEPETMCWEMTEEKGWVLQPGIGYLMHTEECIYTKKYVPVLDGKSSIGRLFVQIHITAGFGDPNYFGQYTLEVVAHHPIRIFPGMRIAQIRFHTIAGHVKNMYEGNYKGASARGAVASRAWKQFG